MEAVGREYVVKISGAAVAIVGEPTTAAVDNLSHQITNEAHRVLSIDDAVSVHVLAGSDTAEAETSTTSIVITGHGLSVGDLIVNVTRSNAARVVTAVDANTITVAAVTGQVAGDTIQLYTLESASVNRLNGTVTFAEAVAVAVRVTGKYHPMTAAAYADTANERMECGAVDVGGFGATHKSRIPTLKSASGMLSHFDIADTTFRDALTAGDPVVIEHRASASEAPNRFWALLTSSEVAAAIDGVQKATVSWVSYDRYLRLGE